MRIAFLVERPTQFEAPFYRFAAGDPEHELRVIFLAPDAARPAFDPELSRRVDWGIDLLGGYPCRVCPRHRVELARFLAAELDPALTDLLIVNGYTRPPYLLANAMARRRGIATALRLDTAVFPAAGGGAGTAVLPTARERLRRLLFTRVVSRTYDLFLGAGSLTLDYLRTCGVPQERAGLFPYAVDVDSFRRQSRLSLSSRSRTERLAWRDRLGIPADGPLVLALAKLNAREAPWDLLAALPAVATAGVSLAIAGDGPERAALARAAAERGLARVRFVGYVPYPELPALYAAADLFVHAAREERWGVSVQEALACGLPAIAASTVGAGYDLIAEGRNGFRYPAGDGAALARAIDRALALDRAAVDAASRAVLSRWDYAATWRGLVAAAHEAVAAVAARRRRERARADDPDDSGHRALRDAQRRGQPRAQPGERPRLRRADPGDRLGERRPHGRDRPPLCRRGRHPALRPRPDHPLDLPVGARQPADPQRLGAHPRGRPGAAAGAPRRARAALRRPGDRRRRLLHPPPADLPRPSHPLRRLRPQVPPEALPARPRRARPGRSRTPASTCAAGRRGCARRSRSGTRRRTRSSSTSRSTCATPTPSPARSSSAASGGGCRAAGSAGSSRRASSARRTSARCGSRAATTGCRSTCGRSSTSATAISSSAASSTAARGSSSTSSRRSGSAWSSTSAWPSCAPPGGRPAGSSAPASR